MLSNPPTKNNLTPKRKNQFLKYIILIVIVSLILFLGGSKVRPEDIAPLIENAGIWAPIFYILILSVTYIIPPLSGTPIFLAGYPLFGKQVIIYVYLATLLSATVSFWISKIWGRRIVGKFVGKNNMQKMDQFSETYGIKTLIFLRVFQGYLFDFVSYAYGLTKIKFWQFFIVCALGSIPWLSMWYFYFLERTENLGDFTIWFAISLIPFYLVSLFFIVKLKRNKNG